MAQFQTITEQRPALFNACLWPVFLTVCLILPLIVSMAVPAQAAQKKKGAAPNPKYAAIVMDASTGEVLYERNPDKRLHPASLTKIMTLLMTFEALEQGRLKPDQKLPVSRHAANMAPSKLGLSVGSSIVVRDAVYALVTKSANDIAVVLAEAIGGSEAQFAAMMTRRAHEIGMTNSTFRNASGLHNPGQISSARDMALLGRFIITHYPQYYRVFSKRNFSYAGVNHHNHNRLMEKYEGMDGIKTGYIGPSGFNLVASAVRDNRRLIGVVFGGRTSQSRNEHMAELLDNAFANRRDVMVAMAQPPVPGRKPQAAAPASLAALSGVAPAPGDSVAAPVAVAAVAPIPSPAAPTASQVVALQAAPLGPVSAPIVPQAAPQVAQVTVTQTVTGATTDAVQVASAADVAEEGDLDPDVTKRFEAGLIAIAAYRSQAGDGVAPASNTVKTAQADPWLDKYIEPAAGGQAVTKAPAQKKTAVREARTIPASYTPGKWSVQIGAFDSRSSTDTILKKAHRKLPYELSHAEPLIVPVKSSNGKVRFRARLSGLSRSDATKACRYFKECLPIAPNK